MMDEAEFWQLSRRIKPQDFFGLIEAFPILFPLLSIDRPISIEITGSGGGVWLVRLLEGKLVLCDEMGEEPLAHWLVDRRLFREIVGGSFRDKARAFVERKQGHLRYLDLRLLPLCWDRLPDMARMNGTIVVSIRDKDMAEVYDIGFSPGGRCPDMNVPTTVIETDKDELFGWLEEGISPLKVLRRGYVKISGDLNLPMGIAKQLYVES